MPLQNRVQPTGEIITHPARGTFMGNRGILHDENRQLGTARWRHNAWVTCRLAFKDRRRLPMTPGTYTELFFHDEAVAFAAGHRPCAECRRADYNRFRAAAGLDGAIKAFDAALHSARIEQRPYRQRRFSSQIRGLPDGTFILSDAGMPMLIWKDALWPFRPEGYGQAQPFDTKSKVTVITPAPLVDVLRAGYALSQPSGL